MAILEAGNDSFALARKVGGAMRRKRKQLNLTMREVAESCGIRP